MITWINNDNLIFPNGLIRGVPTAIVWKSPPVGHLSIISMEVNVRPSVFLNKNCCQHLTWERQHLSLPDTHWRRDNHFIKWQRGIRAAVGACYVIGSHEVITLKRDSYVKLIYFAMLSTSRVQLSWRNTISQVMITMKCMPKMYINLGIDSDFR